MRKCPQPNCDLTVTTLNHYVLETTDGPVEHVWIVCPDRHWFNMPAFLLAGNDGRGWIFK